MNGADAHLSKEKSHHVLYMHVLVYHQKNETSLDVRQNLICVYLLLKVTCIRLYRMHVLDVRLMNLIFLDDHQCLHLLYMDVLEIHHLQLIVFLLLANRNRHVLHTDVSDDLRMIAKFVDDH